jgi:hypothetical protein
MQDTLLEQIKLCSAISLSLDQFEAGDLAFDLALGTNCQLHLMT